ncbi:MAG: hypothetical protein CMM58_03620 [Rhodospirillaceae bacterium]|nr:hypothetical protein [Rhodospirillaceae bacterium]|tara:strand:- start:419 stop:1342 length:924 start_codon:yes stop_codon:yes gene_type:complete
MHSAYVQIETAAQYSIARSALETGHFDLSLRSCYRIIDLDPEYHDAFWCLAEANHGLGNNSEALKWYQRYLNIHPDDPQATHMVAALGTGFKPLRASNKYIKEVFDNFAEEYDTQLIDDLEYKVPDLLYGLFNNAEKPKKAAYSILDLGCGTGLMGSKFREVAHTLMGVDLSPEMLRVAREKRVYDQLVEAEINTFMHSHPSEFDLIIAADVFCYIGDLSETFEAAAGALKLDGSILLTVESQRNRGFVLTESGRYAHKPAYIGKVAKTKGLQEVIGKKEVIRTEYGKPVEGYLLMLRKPSDASLGQ